MSKRLPSISIPKPCSENWDNMQASSKGAFCKTCAVEVIDFTKMSNEEIIEYLEKRKNERVCGKINTVQLEQKKIQPIPPANLYSRFRKILLSFFIGLSFTPFVKGQNTPLETTLEPLSAETQGNRMITGLVVDDKGGPMFYVNIDLYYKDEFLRRVSSDIDGKFELSVEYKYGPQHLKLVFKYLGTEGATIVNLDKDYYEITLKEEEVILIGSIEVKTKGKLKKKRKKNKKTIIGTPRF